MMEKKYYVDVAREYDEIKARGEELENLVPVRARVSKTARAVFSLRLAPAELNKITAAAQRRGLSISDFIRTASLAAAHGGLDLALAEQAEALQALRDQVEAENAA